METVEQLISQQREKAGKRHQFEVHFYLLQETREKKKEYAQACACFTVS